MPFFNAKWIFNIKKKQAQKDIIGSHYYCLLALSIFSINIASYKLKDSLTRRQHLYKIYIPSFCPSFPCVLQEGSWLIAHHLVVLFQPAQSQRTEESELFA